MLYREEEAKVYTRASDILINNPLPESGLVPQIRFNEEFVVTRGEESIPQGPSGACFLQLTPETAGTEFNLLHPVTDEVIGTATYQDLQVLLYSLYLHAAELRDNAPPPNDPAVQLGEGNLIIDGGV